MTHFDIEVIYLNIACLIFVNIVYPEALFILKPVDPIDLLWDNGIDGFSISS
ncbi:MAG: hypothetical protein Q4C95_02520 [Planctomycetia bacterium]|nr:hypothetical protein [Planctomycetia bacterium]